MRSFIKKKITVERMDGDFELSSVQKAEIQPLTEEEINVRIPKIKKIMAPTVFYRNYQKNIQGDSFLPSAPSSTTWGG